MFIAEALARGVTLQELYVDDHLVDDPRIAAVLADAERLGITAWCVPDGVLERVGDTRSSQGLLAVADRPSAEPEPAGHGFVLVLADVTDPGNAGTLVRAAVASGADAVVAIDGVDLTNPKVIRASAGTIFAIPIIERSGIGDTLDDLRRLGHRPVGAVPRGGVIHTEADLGASAAIVVGNEAHGLDVEAIDYDDLVTIDMAGPAESLNVAMAGTILCFEAARRRGAGSVSSTS